MASPEPKTYVHPFAKEDFPVKELHVKRPTPRLRPRTIVVVLLLILLVAVVVGAYFFGMRRAGGGMTEDKEVLTAVGKHIMLPKDIEPKIGKMQNPEQFKSDPFLSQAEIGDYILFYPYEGRTVKAILWRPSLDRVVDVSLVSIQTPGGATQ